MNRFLALIPARYASGRLPGKPLADIGGKPMIQRVYERASESFGDCYVATDDQRIYDVVLAFGGNVVMTSGDHRSGTDRCAEAARNVMTSNGKQYDIVVNIQGDEPFLSSEHLEKIRGIFEDPNAHIGTLVKRFSAEEDIFNPNSPKVVIGADGRALYFSRSPIPFIRDAEKGQWQSSHVFYKHIGLYAYRLDVLEQITRLPAGNLEKAESLEQLRWLENGFVVKVAETFSETVAVDTQEDLERVRDILTR